jgi:hypothetical protein
MIIIAADVNGLKVMNDDMGHNYGDELMIIQTGMRTDIPAFYPEWLINRIKEGYVLVRNPYNPVKVTRYSLSPEVADLMVFCTKNPEPMLKYKPHFPMLREDGELFDTGHRHYHKNPKIFVY